MRLIDADKGLISKIQRKTGCNFITAQEIVDSMLTVQAIPLDKVKHARDEMESNLIGLDIWDVEEKREYYAIKKCIEILDKLIEGEVRE